MNRKPVYVDYIDKLLDLYEVSNDLEKAREVIVASLAANETNVELWALYINWTLKNDYINKGDDERTKEVFEDARSKVGSHPKAWRIWKKYAEFELMRDNKNTTNLIYYTALCSQLEDIDSLIADYTQFVDSSFDKFGL